MLIAALGVMVLAMNFYLYPSEILVIDHGCAQEFRRRENSMDYFACWDKCKRVLNLDCFFNHNILISP